MLRLRPPQPDFRFPSLFSRFFVRLRDLDWRLELSCWRDLVFLFRSIAFLLSTEGQGPSRSLWESPHARERAMDVLLESCSLVPLCIQPDCLRLPFFIPTAIQCLGTCVLRRLGFSISLMVLVGLEILVSSEQWSLLCMKLLLVFTSTRMRHLWVNDARLFARSQVPDLFVT